MVGQKTNRKKSCTIMRWCARYFFAIVAIVGAFAMPSSALAQEAGVMTAPAAPLPVIKEVPIAPTAPPVSAAPQAAGGVVSAESAPVVAPAMPQSVPMQEIRVLPVIIPYNASPAAVQPPLSQQAPAIVLVVPQKSEAYRLAAQALRMGFMAAARAAQAEERCQVVEHEVGQVLDAFREAQRMGVQVIVGPLVREDFRALLHVPPQVQTIALTQLEDSDVPIPDKIFQLMLTVESDARLLAQELLLNGKTNVVLLSGETVLMKRFGDAFMDEWLKIGEMPPRRIQYQPETVAELRTQLGTLAPSAVVLAVEGNDAVLAYAQTKAWPTYASGHIYQRAAQFEGFAFDRLRVVEIPWLVDSQAERFRALGAVPDSPATARLYALGFDAFQVAASFLGGAPLSLDIHGASGHIRFDPKEGLLRNGQMSVFDGGSLRALSAH